MAAKKERRTREAELILLSFTQIWDKHTKLLSQPPPSVQAQPSAPTSHTSPVVEVAPPAALELLAPFALELLAPFALELLAPFALALLAPFAVVEVLAPFALELLAPFAVVEVLAPFAVVEVLAPFVVVEVLAPFVVVEVLAPFAVVEVLAPFEVVPLEGAGTPVVVEPRVPHLMLLNLTVAEGAELSTCDGTPDELAQGPLAIPGVLGLPLAG